MNKAEAIWSELENRSVFTSPFVFKGYAGTVLPNIYLALTREKHRAVAVQLSSDKLLDIKQWNNLEGIRLELFSDLSNATKQYLLIILTADENKEIFTVVVEDLIQNVSNTEKENVLVREILNRLGNWKSLFAKAGQEGLSDYEQQGLFSELYTLRLLLRNNSSDKHSCISSWLGPKREAKDFQWYNWAIEVKSSITNQHQKVQITNERQLDTENLAKLYLYHLSLQRLQQNGESLNNIVDSILTILEDDYSALVLFKSNLLAGNYFNHHRALYDDIGYEIRQATFYDVKDRFPRLTEADMPNGVGEVKYTIIISYCSPYEVEEGEVLESISFK